MAMSKPVVASPMALEGIEATPGEDLLLADEPTGNLDATSTGRVMDLLTALNNSGATVLIATHDHTIYRDVDHRLLELRGGQMHQLRDGVMQ